MSDTKDTDKKPLSLNRPGKLELKKRVETGQVRQSFSHGRSKMVTVEVKKKRTYTRNSDGKMSQQSQLVEPPEVTPTPTPEASRATAAAEKVFEENLSKLTEGEKAARAKALEEARLRAEDEAARLEIEAKEKAAQEKLAQEQEALNAAAEEKAARAPEALNDGEGAAPAKEAAQETKVGQKRGQGENAPETARSPRSVKSAKPTGDDDDGKAKGAHRGDGHAKKPDADKKPVKRREEERRPAPRKSDEKRRRSGKLTIADALSDGEERGRSLAAVRRAREKEKQKQKQARATAGKIMRDVVIPETITVQELANRMAERAVDVIRELMKMGVMSTINQVIDADTAELVVAEFGHTARRVSEADVEIGLAGIDDAQGDLAPRAPVVTVMGHVDHGKTSLLDALRSTDVVSGEAGGITQHIGAYQVTTESGAKITFVDTPGHAAFTDMRARGAKVTDLVILVVAADDGIMPQTVEAIHHAKAADVPIIVAINKCDKPEADPARVRTELLQHELVPEELGGDVMCVEVSAKARTNLGQLEETILLQAEMLDLKANPDRPAEGVVIEAKMEQGRGSVATVLVQRGTLRKGDIFVAGSEWGRVRALIDDHGGTVDAAGPAVPVEVLGLNGTPEAGDEMVVVDSDTRAREVSEYRQRKKRDVRAAAGARGTLEQMFERIQEGEAEELPVVIKADVHGSLEAILTALEKLSTDEVKARVLHAAVGGINESDVVLARASGGFIIGFNVRANAQARDLSRRDGVDIRYYSIIYDVTDDMRKALSGMLAPTIRENFLGYAEVREVFNVSKVGKVAGCIVTDGMVRRGSKVRLLRDDVVVHEGDLSQLKRFKDDVKEVKEGTECGMAFANYDNIKVGDQIECFEVEEVAREL
ncbi:translation initiation factor IF-2 [Varunaivibrio sulfuroxidans]|uniref:Translation initiation factor IF-2 n=1 Tax=Varunaivibrio sulfuroxidans TaxID=1773489 RepID=A0A4R3JFY4_9PROT|nr:translation initiation factor IF-2 [Varunaivibrio sulfuroxidans]TCS65059.1 translation initiation factor 2 (bIF-2) [Varunaivibrio sulfuroxidans]WES29654.1 translation initiation factor IF-2 [Varunaivibrio sulfuroxidans]